MSARLTVHSAAGTRDFLPDEMALRNRVRRIIEESFELYGFQPLETPSLERLEVLTGKYGRESDRLIFKILKRGDELREGLKTGELCDLGLRFDLTVPLARVIAMNRGKLVFPFKRYQIQPVWRAERPQKGRYREFIQCDADIVGTASVSADAEIIALTDDILQQLGISGYRIHINHRMLLQALTRACGVPDDRFLDACITIDKLDKIGWDGVRAELRERSFGAETIDRLIALLEVTGEPAELLKNLKPEIGEFPEGQRGLEETRQLFGDLEALGVPRERMLLNIHLARGLDYYTGPIYETLVEEPRIGSITGGGRYDDLIGLLSGEDIPATGTTIGIERIFDVMQELGLVEAEAPAVIKVLVAVFSDETRGDAFKVAAELRRADIPTEVYLEATRKLGKQFAYADKHRIPYVVVVGPDEVSRGEVTVKDMVTGQQVCLARSALVDQLISELEERKK